MIASLFGACKSSSNGSFQTDAATGVEYKFFKHDENGAKPKEGDFARVKMLWKDDKDSVMLDTRKKGGDSSGVLIQAIPLNKKFPGCLEAGILMMAQGDSAEFLINADSLYMRTFSMRQSPPYVRHGAKHQFYITLVKFESQDQMKAEQQQEMMKRQMEVGKLKTVEPAAIANFLATGNYSSVKPTPDSLFFLMRSGGKMNKPIKEGDSIQVTYTCYLLDGTVCDKTGESKPYRLMYSEKAPILKGWIEALGTMHEGEKVKILIPSWLAYGARPMGPNIKPYSSLVFDIEVLKVKS
jgi:FKBP-type peptidyl-prolyl cis-trans isomerase FkpA